jgi:hypothetical protein
MGLFGNSHPMAITLRNIILIIMRPGRQNIMTQKITRFPKRSFVNKQDEPKNIKKFETLNVLNMKRALLITALLIMGIALSANAQEVGVYESNVVKRSDTGEVYETTSIFTITEQSLILSYGPGSWEYSFSGNPGQTTKNGEGFNTVYLYYSGTNRFAFDFVKNRNGQVTRIDMYTIVPVSNRDDDGVLRLDAQFIISRRIN